MQEIGNRLDYLKETLAKLKSSPVPADKHLRRVGTLHIAMIQARIDELDAVYQDPKGVIRTHLNTEPY